MGTLGEKHAERLATLSDDELGRIVYQDGTKSGEGRAAQAILIDRRSAAAEERARSAEERAERAEGRARRSEAVSWLSLATAVAALALRLFG